MGITIEQKAVCRMKRHGCLLFFNNIRKYKLQSHGILILQEKLQLKAVCLLGKYVDRRFSYSISNVYAFVR